MKQKRRVLFLLAAVLCVACLLVSCGKSGYDGSNNASPENPGIKSDTLVQDRKIIVRAYYTIETRTFDETLKQIETVTAEAGGYVSDSRVSPARDGDSGNATLTLRIPSTAADGFITTLSGIGNVIDANVSKDDVTLTYDDVAARVAVLRAEQAKLLELLDAATDMSDILKIRQQYTDVTQELSSYESQLKSLENAISYATFTVYLRDVKSYSDGGENFIVRFGRSFGKSFVSFAKVLGNVLIVLVYLLPYLLIAAAVVLIIVFTTRKNRRKRAQTAGERQDVDPSAPEGPVPMRFGTRGGNGAPMGNPMTDGDETPDAGDTPTTAEPQEEEGR